MLAVVLAGDSAVAIIGAIGALVASVCTSVAGLIIAVRNGRTATRAENKAGEIQTAVAGVHDCVHKQAERTSALIVNQARIADATGASLELEPAQVLEDAPPAPAGD